jgi:ABC-type uncharacterized transport system YnjBCD permease subunit
MAVSTAHMTIGALVVAINVLAGLWGLWTWRRGRESSRGLTQVLALSHTVIFAQAAFGLYLLSGGFRAPESLHYVYGLLPAGVVAFAYSARTADQRRNLLVFSIAALIAGSLSARAYMTGKGGF